MSIHGAGLSVPGGTRQKVAPRAFSDETFSVIREGSILVTESCVSKRDLSEEILLVDNDPTYTQTYNCEDSFDIKDSPILLNTA